MSVNLLIKQESNLFDKRMVMEAVGLEGTECITGTRGHNLWDGFRAV